MVALQPGGQLVVSVGDFAYTTIRSTCADLSWQYRRKYSCHRNREDRTYTVTRIS